MRTRKKTLAAAGSLSALALVLAGCGDDGGSGGGSGDLEGVSVTIGSKDFTENILLGEMLAQALEANGADVTNKVNLGGTQVNRKALTSGDIDVYPEYTGTVWTEVFGEDYSSDEAENLYTMVGERDLKENDIKWVGVSPFNDTYGFAANGDLAEAEGPFDFQGMADYLEANPDATLCMESEFPDRSDGLVLFEKNTGYTVPDSQQEILETGLIYTETDKGACDFGEVFTTDARIEQLNLELVEDPGVMILYNASFTMQNSVYKANAETYDELAQKIFEPLDEAKMTELNGLVDLEGQPAEGVAEDYLKEIGVLD